MIFNDYLIKNKKKKSFMHFCMDFHKIYLINLPKQQKLPNFT